MACGQTVRNCTGRLDGFFGDTLRQCTLHGVKYTGFQNRHFIERIFWIIAVLTCFGLASDGIYNIYQKYLDNPIITTFQSTATDIDEIPFPAITLCNVNILKGPVMWKAFKELVDELGKPTINSTGVMDAIGLLEFLAQFCLSAQSFRRLIGEKLSDAGGKDDFVSGLMQQLKLAESQIQKANESRYAPEDVMRRVGKAREFLYQASHNCTDMLIKCSWDDEFVDCNKIFRNLYTANGICCTFNLMPSFILRKNLENNSNAVRERRRLNLSPADILEWNEFGRGELYGSENRSYPKHQFSGGQQYGLTLLVNPELDLYSTCTTTDGSGFRITPHSPSSFPSVEEYGVAVSPRHEVFVEIEPQVTVADRGDLAHVGVDKRGCLFPGDKAAKLLHYNFYTAANCMDECIARHTFWNCSCVKTHMPKGRGQHYCNAKQVECADRVQAKLAGHGKSGGDCKCLPSCTEIKYKLRVTAFPMRKEHSDELLDGDNPFKEDPNDRKGNFSIVHLYIGSEVIYTKERKRLYTISDLIGQAGGLLSLWFGFSIIVVIEIVYFFTLKAWFHLRPKMKCNGENKGKGNNEWSPVRSIRKRKSSPGISSKLISRRRRRE